MELFLLSTLQRAPRISAGRFAVARVGLRGDHSVQGQRPEKITRRRAARVAAM